VVNDGVVKMASPAAAAGDVGTRRVENQLKIQQLESDALRMRLIDAESCSDRRRRTLGQGTAGPLITMLLRFSRALVLIHSRDAISDVRSKADISQLDLAHSQRSRFTAII